MARALPVRCTRDLFPVEPVLRCNWCIAVAGAAMICSMVLLPLLSFVGSELLSLVQLPYEMDLRSARAVMPTWSQGIVASRLRGICRLIMAACWLRWPRSPLWHGGLGSLDRLRPGWVDRYKLFWCFCPVEGQIMYQGGCLVMGQRRILACVCSF